MEIFLPYVAGQFVESSLVHSIRNPFSGNEVAKACFADNAMMEEAIAKGAEAQKLLAKMPAWKRAEILHFIADQLQENAQYHASLLATEAAKPLRYASTEIDRAIQTFRVAAEETKRINGELIRMDWTKAGQGHEGIIKFMPVGLVAGISPFNFPLNLAVHKIAPAIAAGCPIVLKPASSTPLSTMALARILHMAGLPNGAVSVLPADRHVGNMLVTDPRIKLLSFTGSDTIGWKMKAEAGKKKTVLELGGNAGVIIAQSAHPDHLLDLCLQGAFAYSGQVCIHAQRFFVHAQHYDYFVENMRRLALNLTCGAPELQQTEFSSMIDEPNAIRVHDWIQEAVNQGAELVCGGQRNGAFVDPTILTHTHQQMKVNAEEIFGPVITIQPFHHFEQAVQLLNHSRFGLQAGVFTNNIHEMDYSFAEIEAGGIILNNVPTLRFDHMPYGGIKDSGLGREGVKYAMQDMLETKILVKSF